VPKRLGFQQRLAQLEPDSYVRRDPERLPLGRVGALDDRDDLGRDAPVKADVLLERIPMTPVRWRSAAAGSCFSPSRWATSRMILSSASAASMAASEAARPTSSGITT